MKMYYDQLLALSRDYHNLLVRVVNDYTITDSENDSGVFAANNTAGIRFCNCSFEKNAHESGVAGLPAAGGESGG